MRPQTDASYASGARSIWIEASVTWLTCPVDGELGATLPTARGTEKRTNLRRRYHPLSGHQKRVLGDNVFYGVLTSTQLGAQAQRRESRALLLSR